MTITVKLFAWLREYTQTEECRLILAPAACAADAREALSERYPGLRRMFVHVRPAVNLSYTSWEAPLNDGDELTLVPPVSGG